MSTTTPTRPGRATSATGPLPVPRRAPHRRARPGLIALAVAMVAVGGLTAAYAVTLVGSSKAYLAVARPVAVGTVITTADITTVRITADPALRPIPADRINRIIGKHAAVELVAGTLLTDEALTDSPIPGPGKSLVGLGLPVDRLPASRIKPGVAVVLVTTPNANGVAATTPTTGPPKTYPATVVDVSRGAKDSVMLVNVAVDTSDAATVAALAATDRLVIVLAGS